MKQKRAALVAATLLGFAGLLAFHTELWGKSDDRPWLDALEHGVIDQEPRLSPAEEALLRPRKLEPLPPEKIDTETLWLARAIYSESKRPEEQLLIAWVVRNRVETRFRGKRTYESVVLDPYQFSAFLPEAPKRPYYANLGPASGAPGWNRALRIAHAVRSLDPIYRPFSAETRHFYSARSLGSRLAPSWARDIDPISLSGPYRVEQNRFRFFEGIL